MTVGRTQTALGAFYRRLSARVGKAKAVTATARKIATLFYNALRHGMDYADPGASSYEDRYRARVLANLRRRAKSLGYTLHEMPAPGVVSQEGPVPRRIGRTKGGLNSKLHAVCDGYGRPLVMLLSEGQMSDYKGAALMLPAMPKAKQLLADKGYDADWLRAALAKRRIAACIPSKSNRKTAIPHDAVLYKQRHKIENMFGRLKDWRRIHIRYDRCAHTYFSAICIAATVVFWL